VPCLSTEACGEHFSFADVISFPRPKSEPIITAAAPPMPVMRQPRYDPDVLGRGGTEADVRDGLMEERRQPRASNASVSSLTVSRQVQPLRDNAASQVLPTGRQAQPVRGNPVSKALPAGRQAQPISKDPVLQAPPAVVGKSYLRSVL